MPGPVKVLVTSRTTDPDTGLLEFSFKVKRGPKIYSYKVLPKSGTSPFLIYEFLKYLEGAGEKRGVDPFTYKDKDKFDIIPTDKPPTERLERKPQEPEQMSLKFARKLEVIASELDGKGLCRLAEMLKPVALRFRKAWLGPKSIGFFDDLGNENIQSEDAMAVMDAFEAGSDAGSQAAEATGLPEPLCAKVIGLAKKHLLS